MSLEICILASGSSGNATVLRSPAGAMLIDAGNFRGVWLSNLNRREGDSDVECFQRRRLRFRIAARDRCGGREHERGERHHSTR